MTDRVVRVIVRLGIGGLLAVNFSGELFPHQACKQVNGLKDENGMFFEVPEWCHEQFKDVAMKSDLKNTDKVNLFVNKSFYAVSAGSTLLPNGAVIGLPRWYLNRTKADVENSGINFNGKDIDWDSELGVALKESYLPTKNMIAFTIGHEISHIQRLDFKLLEIGASPLWFYLTFKLCNYIPKVWKLHVAFDIILKLSICGISICGYKFTKQKVDYCSEFRADEMSAMCDPKMAKGGVEFLTRRIKLNLIQRMLLEEEGRKFYTEEGDELNSHTHPKLTERLEKVRKILLRSYVSPDRGLRTSHKGEKKP